EFKNILRNLEIGHEVALFKTYSNVPLKREDKNVYLLSSGVGLATFRPLVVDYFKRTDNVNQLHSLNIDSSTNYLFSYMYESARDKKFKSQIINNRKAYYEEVKNLAADKERLFYVVGSDESLMQNIEVLPEQGVKAEQMMLDKHENQYP